MKRIIKANIERFKQLLKTEADLTKRVMLAHLLGEEETRLEETKLEETKAAPAAAKRAY
jgi:hypothetical protein